MEIFSEGGRGKMQIREKRRWVRDGRERKVESKEDQLGIWEGERKENDVVGKRKEREK